MVGVNYFHGFLWPSMVPLDVFFLHVTMTAPLSLLSPAPLPVNAILVVAPSGLPPLKYSGSAAEADAAAAALITNAAARHSPIILIRRIYFSLSLIG